LQHYHFTALKEYADARKEEEAPITRPIRLAGLVVDAQHRLTKTGKNFGILTLEDFSGKAEFMLWSEDYAKYSHYLEKGLIVMLEGAFKEKYNTGQYEFRVSKMNLLDTAKLNLTKQVILETSANDIDNNFVQFFENNLKQNPGKTALRINIIDPEDNLKICLYSLETGFTMNDEMAHFLEKNRKLDVSVVTV
jgi:DNA polymerase-3 subunit alpha